MAQALAMAIYAVETNTVHVPTAGHRFDGRQGERGDVRPERRS
jgi:hypothetical protein